MCGIIGYVGKRSACPILLDGLSKLEYRGYDSAGIAIHDGKGEMKIIKTEGKVADLRSLLTMPGEALSGIGHTRWATHGPPVSKNAHPHASYSRELALVHNGIVENHQALREHLIKNGCAFSSDTDSEVIVNWIQFVKDKFRLCLVDAIRRALPCLNGSYAVALISADSPGQIFLARQGKALVIGLGTNENYVASDTLCIGCYTNRIVHLKDGEVCVVKDTGLPSVRLFDGTPIALKIETASNYSEMPGKNGHRYFMAKEIEEQPRAVTDCLLENTSQIDAALDCRSDFHGVVKAAGNIHLLSCGTSWHASLFGSQLFEEFARLRCNAQCASEFRYRNPVIEKGDIAIAVSQSGETADTIAATELAKKHGAYTVGICNVENSALSRICDKCFYTRAGAEIAVASTKAYTTQIALFTLLGIKIAELRKQISRKTAADKIAALAAMPNLMQAMLTTRGILAELAAEIKSESSVLFLGRGYSLGVALEGALKLKEISYIHAEGYPAAEMKHGPIALIEKGLKVFVICPRDRWFEKTSGNIEEVRARGGEVIALCTKGEKSLTNKAARVIWIPEVEEHLYPLLEAIPLQILAYETALARGCNPDQPRNLAKSVTVE